MKKDGDKILMIIDVPNWAWAHKAQSIAKYLNDDFRKISIVTNKQFHKGLFNKFNHVHGFGALDKKGCAGKYKAFTAGVSSHNFIYLHPGKAKKYFPRYSALTATSKLIYNELKDRKLNDNIHYCPNGVDETLFTPGEKTENLDKFVVGWSGQPSGTNLGEGHSSLDAHGYHNVLLPLVESLKDNKDIHFQILDRTHKNAKPFEKMREWYRQCDVFLHTGYITGTPNPLFEAAACGIPSISTAIGAAPELITDKMNGLLVPRYFNKQQAKQRVDEIRFYIKWLKQLKGEESDPSILPGYTPMKMAARKVIENEWTWKQRSQAWKEVFLKYRKRI